MDVTFPQNKALNSAWHLECFGNVRVVRGECVVERFRTQKTMALLVLLAHKGTQSRESLCALLWPDAEPEAARNSLSAALSSLRRELGDGVLCADRQNVGLVPGAVAADVAEFDAAMKAGNWKRAVELFSGPLLPGFLEDPLPALAGEYEEKARGAFICRLNELENALATDPADIFPALRSLARRAMTLFGDDERWFVALMRAHGAAGDMDAALRTYESLQRWARKENELVSDAARQLAKALRREREKQAGKQEQLAKISPDEPASTISIQTGQGALSLGNVTAATLNVPEQWTRFFGREAEREVLRNWLCGGEKLVTVSGSGGSGKTRLAIETLRDVAPDWRGRVAFVPLASLFEANLLFSTIRDALALPAAPDVAPLEQLQQALQGQKCLLVLDNFEQLAENGAVLMQKLRDGLPDAVFLITSRVLLRLPGERELPLSPLPTPLQGTLFDEVVASPSVALFCDRAGLAPTETNLEAIGLLCRRLDGIPLALELAAARARMLSPVQILERLERHPDFLQSREWGRPERHKTLRATIEWSVDLLPPELREFFIRLSVFRGGWTLEAAESICAPGVCEEWQTIDYLETLRDHSLLLIQETSTGTRYRLLEMLREWCENGLSDTLRRSLQERHFNHYLQLAEKALNPLILATCSDELECEIPNFRAALSWVLAESASKAAQMAGALCPFWEMRAHFAEGRSWTQRAWEAMEKGDVDPPTRARLACGIGILCWYGGELDHAQARLEEALALHHSLGNRCGEALALEFLARVALIAGDADESRLRGENAVAVARECGDPVRLVGALLAAGWGCHNSNDLEGALHYLGECRAMGEAIGEKRLTLICDATLCFVLQMLGRNGESAALCEAVMGTLDESMGVWTLSFSRAIVGQVSLRLGNLQLAREVLPHDTLQFHAVSTRWEVANMLLSCGDLAMAMEDTERAVLLYGASEALRSRSGCTVVPVLRPLYQQNLARLDVILDNSTRDALWSRGRALSLDEAVALTQDLL